MQLTIDNSIKNLLSNVLDITGEDRQHTIKQMIKDRQDELKQIRKEIYWLNQYQLVGKEI